QLALANMTIASNEVISGSTTGAVAGAGIHLTNNIARALNTILNGNFPSNCSGSIVDDGYNLSSDSSCGFSAPGSLNNLDALLSELASNGASCPTMALQRGSRAID